MQNEEAYERRDYSLEFKPRQQRKRSAFLRGLAGFSAILLLALVASTVALTHDGLLDQILSGGVATTETTTQQEPSWSHTGQAQFLLCQSDNAGKELRFCILVRFVVPTRKCYITAVPPKTKAPGQGGLITLQNAMRQGGAKAVAEAVQSLTETQNLRYIASTEDDFVKAINAMGSVQVQLAERVRYHSPQYTLTLAQGEQTLQGDMLLRYFRYLGQGDCTQQGELMRTTLQTYLLGQEGATFAELESTFNLLANRLQSDISVADFYGQRQLLQDLFVAPQSIQYEVSTWGQ